MSPQAQQGRAACWRAGSAQACASILQRSRRLPCRAVLRLSSPVLSLLLKTRRDPRRMSRKMSFMSAARRMAVCGGQAPARSENGLPIRPGRSLLRRRHSRTSATAFRCCGTVIPVNGMMIRPAGTEASSQAPACLIIGARHPTDGARFRGVQRFRGRFTDSASQMRGRPKGRRAHPKGLSRPLRRPIRGGGAGDGP